MSQAVSFLALSLLLILISAEGFTNAIEALGRRFSFSQAIVGNIFAAVGTALPETILPFVAIFFGRHEAAKDIGLGAILGAPLMLATVAFFLLGLTVMITSLRTHRAPVLNVELGPLKRDLSFFIIMFSTAVFLPALAGRWCVVPLSIGLVCGYVYYVFLTSKEESAPIEHLEGLHFLTLHNKVRRKQYLKAHSTLIFLQIVASLLVMVVGAQIFVKNLEVVSLRLGMSPLLFALLLAPVATELPEKFNSVNWALKGKDALALGNITGAMVFQATFPVSLGLLFTQWNITGMALLATLLAIVSAVIVLVTVIVNRSLSAGVMVFAGSLYVFYALILIFHGR